MEFSIGRGGEPGNSSKWFETWKNNNVFLPNYDPPTQNKIKILWGFVDFKMAANENALTQLGITGIIQNVTGRLDHKTKQNKNCWKTINYFPWEGGRYPSHEYSMIFYFFPGGGGRGYPSMENSMKIINIFVEPFP